MDPNSGVFPRNKQRAKLNTSLRQHSCH